GPGGGAPARLRGDARVGPDARGRAAPANDGLLPRARRRRRRTPRRGAAGASCRRIDKVLQRLIYERRAWARLPRHERARNLPRGAGDRMTGMAGALAAPGQEGGDADPPIIRAEGGWKGFGPKPQRLRAAADAVLARVR